MVPMKAHITIYLCEWIESYGLTQYSILVTNISIVFIFVIFFIELSLIIRIVFVISCLELSLIIRFVFVFVIFFLELSLIIRFVFVFVIFFLELSIYKDVS